jgi:hypothetical protein
LRACGERFAEIATEFVRLKVDVIVTAGTDAVVAAKKATSVIPINVANLLGLALLVSFASVLRRAQRCGASGA